MVTPHTVAGSWSAEFIRQRLPAEAGAPHSHAPPHRLGERKQVGNDWGAEEKTTKRLVGERNVKYKGRESWP